MEKGSNFWLCNSTKEVDGNLVVVDCHTAYHVDKKLYTTTAPPPGITTECSVVSDSTDEQPPGILLPLFNWDLVAYLLFYCS